MTATTISDMERREVARNIRENYVRSGLGYKVASAYNIAMAIGMNPGLLVGDIDLWCRLADLIEPDEPQVKRELKYRSRCDELGAEVKRQRDALLKLADEMDMDAGCHAYVDDYDVYGYARRIRKALGVDDD